MCKTSVSTAIANIFILYFWIVRHCTHQLQHFIGIQESSLPTITLPHHIKISVQRCTLLRRPRKKRVWPLSHCDMRAVPSCDGSLNPEAQCQFQQVLPIVASYESRNRLAYPLHMRHTAILCRTTHVHSPNEYLRTDYPKINALCRFINVSWRINLMNKHYDKTMLYKTYQTQPRENTQLGLFLIFQLHIHILFQIAALPLFSTNYKTSDNTHHGKPRR